VTVGRILICNTCQRDWDVIELPCEFLHPSTYVCGDCLQPVAKQLTVDENRSETRRYDPATAPLPEGF